MQEAHIGYCPRCGARGKFRERRPNGNDECERGCVYPSATAMTAPVPAAQLEKAQTDFERGRLSAINHPELNDFARAIVLEAQHQRERHGALHDRNKTADDWLWTAAHLLTKAAQASRYGDIERYKHHIITGAALLANWHRIVAGGEGSVVPEGGWEALANDIAAFCEKAFPDATLHTRMEVVRRESVELEMCDGKDLTEYPDLLLPILHSAKMAGYDVNDLLRACWDKVDVIKKREWGPPDEHGVRHHIKKGAAAAALAAMIATAPADAQLLQLVCDRRPNIVELLKGNLQEQQTGLGHVTARGIVYELWTAKDGKTWTLMFSRTDGVSCLVAQGDDWSESPFIDPTNPS